ncbi:hypothetical protein ACIQ6V_25355 [Streptomyces sp. NPDC096198]|uniref:aromatic-ring hydroxylase C-terminal domain-containing protein n=1 Tax=Streptomyces sp. NPDC096198 TaxID=3366080 RepID=UPI0037F339D0
MRRCPECSLELARRQSGLSVAYPAAEGHPLSGRRAPDLPVEGRSGLFGLLRPGRHVLLDLTGRTVLDAPGHRAAPDTGRAEWAGVRAALVRPDGHVAWASDESDDAALGAAARAALAATHR